MKKKLFLGFLAFVFVFNLSGQNDSLMPNLSAHYSISCSSGDPGNWNTWYYDFYFNNPNLEFDTVEVSSPGYGVFAKLYADSLKVFIKMMPETVLPDCYVGWSEEMTDGWNLLYDYSLQVGDTAYYVWGDNGIITSIEDVEIQGETRKKFYLNGVGDPYSYIQGIGSLEHPFIPMLYVFEVVYEVCESELYYQGPSAIDTIVFSPDCNGEILSVPSQEKNEWTIYPNPSTGLFKIRGVEPKTYTSIKVYNIHSEEIGEYDARSVSNDEIQVDLSNHPSGMYTILFQGGERNDAKRVLVIH